MNVTMRTLTEAAQSCKARAEQWQDTSDRLYREAEDAHHEAIQLRASLDELNATITELGGEEI